MKFFTLLFFSLFVLSCNTSSEKPANTSQASPEAKTTKQLKFEIEIETSKPDDFMLISNNLFLNNAQFMTIVIKQKLTQTESSKTMSFEFPEDITPDYNLAFSLGDKHEKEVKFIRANLEFDSLNFTITEDNFLEYFTLNDFVNYDETKKMFITKTVDGKHEPKFFLKRKFLDKMSGF